MSNVRFIFSLRGGICDKLLCDKSIIDRFCTCFKDILSNAKMPFDEKFKHGDLTDFGNCP